MNRNKKFKRDILIGLLTKGKYRIYGHILLLLLVGSTILSMGPTDKGSVALYGNIIFSFFLLFLFYTNMYWLVPWFLFKKRYVEYFVGILVYIVIAFYIVGLTRNLMPPSPVKLDREIPDFKIFPFIFLSLIFVAASSAINLFLRWIKDAQRINELEKITIQSELEQLKNQINPHFLFNMLNTANVLTQKDPQKASQVLIKLSDLLRYQLYDTARSKVLLTADIHFLEDFLMLEKIRRDNFECSVWRHGDLDNALVSPLLFIAFIENAVKYNVDTEKTSFVHLHFNVQNNDLYFTCINSKPEIPIAKNNIGGLGLANVKRRLELLYPSAHKLCIEDGAQTYSLTLTIKL